ncbi:MAG: stage II sporulation protein P [Clostridia bacterium]|nr:stage II sporulation protein P [Clostridia bacterium]
MKHKEAFLIKFTVFTVVSAILVGMVSLFKEPFINSGIDIVYLAAKSYLPEKGITFYPVSEEITVNAAVTTVESSASQVSTENEKTTSGTTQVQKLNTAVVKNEALTAVDEDIRKLIEEKEKTAAEDKKDGDISEYQYINDGVTDKYGLVRVKNVNKTEIDIEKKLSEKIDLSVDKQKPAVLIFHTHTTETYQILDRGFYEEGFMTRSNDSSQNMVRVGKAICEQIEKAGYKVIHDTAVYDGKYSGAYDRSRAGVAEYLKKYPSIQVVLDIHRDAIQQTDGTKIKPVAEIDGKKAAQVMIISGCQEEGNSVTNLPDWKYNLTFAVHLQNKLEELFEGITRPLYFCPRSYNMNLTHCSLLIEVGSDSNTLDEAVYTGKCIGRAVAEILKEYEE